MPDYYMCQTAWDLFMKWDSLSKANEQGATDEAVTAENQAWTAYQDHKASCEECKRTE